MDLLNKYERRTDETVFDYFGYSGHDGGLFGQSVAQWYTSMGTFKVELREDYVPITVNNFKDLTNANFYDNLIFHRVIAGFMNQDG